MDDQLQKAAEQVRKAKSVAVLTGAGISAESGIPTFRDALSGLWSQFNAEELATPEAFKRNPELVWQWYFSRRTKNAICKPNSGHVALVQLESHIADFTLITQNVDGLHQAAGSKNVIELHGSLKNYHCFDNHHRIDTSLVDSSPERPPQCPVCGSLARPGVVWFGEQLPENEIRSACDSIERADTFFVIGTSGQVQPAASFGTFALNKGACVIVINPDASANINKSIFLQGPAGEVLPKLVVLAWPD